MWTIAGSVWMGLLSKRVFYDPGVFRMAARNLLSDVPGVSVGHAEERALGTGVTVVRFRRFSVASVSCLGGAPGSSETELLRSGALVGGLDALVFAGGSVFGLEAASAVRHVLYDEGRGFPIADRRIPIVPAAVIYDFTGRDRSEGIADYRLLGAKSVQAAGEDFALGSVGAGLGARAGSLKGGIGSCSLRFKLYNRGKGGAVRERRSTSEAEGDPDGDYRTIGALAVVNSRGSVLMPGSPCFWAWPFERENEFGGRRPDTSAVPFDDTDAVLPSDTRAAAARASEEDGRLSHTTLGVVATDLPLDRHQAQRVAVMAHDGFARAIRPVHTPFDGDIVFAVSTAEKNQPPASMQDVFLCGLAAGDVMARSIARAVYAVSPGGGLKGAPAWQDVFNRESSQNTSEDL